MFNRWLFCFDVDGTLDCKENDNEEYLKGTIPEDVLVELWKKGHKITIVSPSPFFPKKWKGENHWFARNDSNDYRWENIKDAISYYMMDKFNTIYIDDLPSNRSKIQEWGVISFDPDTFMEIYNKGWFE